MDIGDLAYLLIFLFFILGNAILPLLKKKKGSGGSSSPEQPQQQPQQQPRQDSGDPFEEIFGELRDLGRKEETQPQTRNLEEEAAAKRQLEKQREKTFEDYQRERMESSRKLATSAMEDKSKRMNVINVSKRDDHFHFDARLAIIHQAILERKY